MEPDYIPSNFDVSQYLEKDPGSCVGYPSPNPGDEGKLRFTANVSHHNYDCPIAFPGQPGRMPLMQYFGNDKVDAFSNYQSMRTTGDGSCSGGPINRSSYYYPAILRPQNNKVMIPSVVIVYYTIIRRDLTAFTSPNTEFRAPGQPFSQYPAQLFPRGIRWIWGNRVTDPPVPMFTTEAGGGMHTTFESLADAPGTGGRVIITTNAPSCWNGVDLDSGDHRSHMTYPVQDSYGNAIASPTHPHVVPQITIKIFLENDGPEDFRHWRCSTDGVRPGGSSMRFFYMEAWDRPILEDAAGRYIMGLNGGEVHTGNNGQLCTPDHSKLTERHLPAIAQGWVNPGAQPLSSRYMDIPPETAPTVYKLEQYNSFRLLENSVQKIDSMTLEEARWLCGILKIPSP